MEILLHMTNPSGARIGVALARACERAGIIWGCFVTNDGVRVLADPAFVQALRSASRAVACEHSWRHYMGEMPCTVKLGSQTVNSELVAEARRTVSL